MHLNEFEIDLAVKRHAGDPAMGRATRVLAEYRDIVNERSDGWCSWRAGTRPADSLMELVARGHASVDDVAQATRRIASFCTRRGFPKPASL